VSTDGHLGIDGRVRRRAGLVALGGAMACWGSTVVTIKIAARGLTTLAITAIEVSTALVVLGFAVLVRRSRPPRPTWGVVCAGVLEPGLSYVLINAGLARTSGTHAGLLIGLQSVFVILFAVLVRRVRLNAHTLVAVALVVAGSALLTSGTDGSADLTGDALVLAGVLAAAVYVLVVQRLALSFDPLVLTFYQFAFGGIVLVPVAGAVLLARPGDLVGNPTVGQIGAALLAGLLGSAVAFVLYNWALGRVTPALAGTSLTLIPVFGVAFSVVFLGESIVVRTVIAGLVVLVGISLTPDAGHAPVRERSRSARSGRVLRRAEGGVTSLPTGYPLPASADDGS
jgi:drug/metabolite transporter (DMT)-like permease